MTSLQEEFDDIVDENMQEFDMNEEDSIKDALHQLRHKKVQFLATTKAQRTQKQRMGFLCSDPSKFKENFPEISLTLHQHPDLFLIHEALHQGCLGGCIHLAVTTGSIPAFQLIVLLCQFCDASMRVVPSVALNVFIDFLLQNNDGQEFAMKALCALLKGTEENKQSLYELGFHDTLHKLCQQQTRLLQQPLCLLIKEYCVETSQTQTSNESFARCRKLGEETDVVSWLSTQAMADASAAAEATSALRAVCVNDRICSRALQEGALDRVLSLAMAKPTWLLSCLLLIRQLVLNDAAKLRIGMDAPFCSLLFSCCGGEEEDDPEMIAITTAALSILVNIALRQPLLCARLAESGMIPLLLDLMGEQCGNREVKKLALMGLRNLISHPENEELRSVALGYSAEEVCRGIQDVTLKTYVEDCLRDLGLANYRL